MSVARRFPLLGRLVVGVLIGGLVGGCSAGGGPAAAPPQGAAPGSPTVAGGAAGTTRPSADAAPARPSPVAPTAAPARSFAVGVRKITVVREGRRLPTTLWYPATGATGGAARSGVPVAAGRFPIVVFSHGLRGLPDYYAALTTRWAAAGFVVAAPAYPGTNAHADPFDVTDVGQQPLDAAAVISKVRGLDTKLGDPLRGRLATGRVGAAGHSAGGFTTLGMLSAPTRDERVDAAIVIAGASLGGTFAGPAASVLFVHGSDDGTVALSGARTAYQKLSWPKGFLTLTGQGHGDYLRPGNRGFDQVNATTTDFWRATLYGDAAARRRLPANARKSGVSTYDSSRL
ncbi:alpha/beta hydrolase family protein [Luedemannella helvata]|uniref:Chlorophyllase n=1 Tax=Luedemannella helvata TaxID=349315 RepID=A0ABN2KAK6_9ACTN